MASNLTAVTLTPNQRRALASCRNHPRIGWDAIPHTRGRYVNCAVAEELRTRGLLACKIDPDGSLRYRITRAGNRALSAETERINFHKGKYYFAEHPVPLGIKQRYALRKLKDRHLWGGAVTSLTKGTLDREIAKVLTMRGYAEGYQIAGGGTTYHITPEGRAALAELDKEASNVVGT